MEGKQYQLLHGDAIEQLRSLEDNSIDSIVTDPPYEIAFMGKGWDNSGIAFNVDVWSEALRVLKPGGHLLAFSAARTYHRMTCAIEDAGFEIRDQIMWLYGSGMPKSHNLKGDWNGWGTALKPAHEPIVLARKPLIGTVAANVLEHGTGALNIDGCRVEGAKRDPGFKNPTSKGIWGSTERMTDWVDADKGRWPANLIHDGSDEVLAAFPNAKGQQGALTGEEPSSKTKDVFGEFTARTPSAPRGDTGTAARFFYCAKASKKDRGEGNNHPTVKPTDLMRYLVRLITPPGGVVLDPFTGSGSTGKAAMLEGFSFIGIDQSAEYLDIADKRITAA